MHYLFFKQNDRRFSAFAVLSFLGVLSFILYLSIRKNGIFSYPIDDTYIHLGIAKSLVNEFTFGISHIHSSCSSSPLFAVMIALFYKLTNYPVFIPLAINTVSGIFLCYLTIKYLSRVQNRLLKYFAFMYIIFSSSLFFQVLMGMEHVIYTLVFTFYLFGISTIFRNSKNNYYVFISVFLGNILCMIRYESMFIIFSILCILLLFREVKLFFVFLLSFSSILLFGIFSLVKGGLFFPNSLMIKGRVPVGTLKDLIRIMMDAFIDRSPINYDISIAIPTLFIILFIILISKIQSEKTIECIKNPNVLVVVLWLSVATLQSLFAGFGWLYRYEFFLCFGGLILIFREIGSVVRKKIFMNFIFSGIILCWGLQISLPIMYFRGKHNGIDLYFKATKAIQNQHLAMADFVKTYYNNSFIGLNDVGAVSFLSDAKILDFAGLCNDDILKLRREKGWDYFYASIYKMCEDKGVDLVLVYDGFYTPASKYSYRKIGELIFPKEDITGGNVVYVIVRLGDVDQARKNLVEFSKRYGSTLQVKLSN